MIKILPLRQDLCEISSPRIKDRGRLISCLGIVDEIVRKNPSASRLNGLDLSTK